MCHLTCWAIQIPKTYKIEKEEAKEKKYEELDSR
jgi:hypothetical protein